MTTALRLVPAAHAPATAPAPAAAPDLSGAALAALTRALAAQAAAHDRDGSFPFEAFARLREAGLLALTVPADRGGAGRGLVDARRVVAAVGAGDASAALVLTMQYLFLHGVAQGNTWPPALRERVLRSAVEEGALGNALRVEPELGSPARGGLPATVARRDGDDWVIDGHKLYSTGIPGLRWLAVWGRTDEPQPRVGVFLVPREVPGLRVIESWDHLGMRATGSHEVILEGVRIPLDHAVDLRAPDRWTQRLDAAQTAWMVVLLGSLYDAVARAGRDWLVAFLKARRPASLGAPLASLPRVQEKLGEIEALLLVNRQLLDQAAEAVDRGEPPSATDSGLLKYVVSGNAIRALDLALQLSGNHGLSRHHPLERRYRDVLCSRIHTPQDDSLLQAAGRVVLGQ